MLLSLRPTDAPQRPTCAALLRGTDPAAWLREISRWGLRADQLRCYLVPESIRSVQPAGLLVVAEAGQLPADVLEPYGVEAGRLYVPVGATLWPATTPAELAAALLWPRQLLHPSIGLVGFDTTDELNLGDLLHLSPARPTDWTRAQPGPPPAPPLRQLRVEAPTAADVVQQLQADIAPAPLTKLPGLAESRPPLGRRLLNWLQQLLLRLGLAGTRLVSGRTTPNTRPTLPTQFWSQLTKGVGLFCVVCSALGLLLSGRLATSGILLMLLFTLALMQKMLGSDEHESPSTRSPASLKLAKAGDKPSAGWLGKAEGWLNRRLDELEKQRQTELNRLLKLFDENPAEALRYAIPLDGPYLNRGTAAPTARLGPRRLHFDLGRLGGGQRVDAWDLGHYQADLRRQYLAAAQREAAAGNHRQAAYIQAHLLGDYRAAAQMLAQGGHFREAAALYRDHLRDLPAAAQCLEQGGLLLEAADLYASLGQPEKAGDLHQQLGQSALAQRYYEQAVTTFFGNHDYLETARVLADKLTAPDRAQATLLQGWAQGRQPESCLGQYFDLAATQPAADLPTQVRTVYQQRTLPAQHGALLRVLAQVTQRHPATLLSAREVAYDIVGQEASTGNLTHLPLLHHFVPNDRLLTGDVSRFGSRQPRRPLPATTTTIALGLDSTIEWHTAITYRHQWLALGLRDNRLHLARGNWYGQVEYYSWLTPLAAHTQLLLVADDRQSYHVLVRLSVPAPLEDKVLPKNKYFSEALLVESPTWLPPWPVPVALLPESAMACAQLVDNAISLHRYRPPATATCEVAGAGLPSWQPLNDWPNELIYHEGRYYTYWDNALGWFSEEGKSYFHALTEPIFQLVRSPYAAELVLAAVTELKVVLWRFTGSDSSLQSVALPLSGLVGGACLNFVGPQHLLVFDGEHSALYYIGEPEPRLVRMLPGTSQRVVAALPTTNREQFALLEASGKLTLHHLNE